MTRHKYGTTIGSAMVAIVLSCFTGSSFAQSIDQPSDQVLAQGMENGSADDTVPATLSATMDWSNFASIGRGYRSSTAMHYSGLMVEVHDATNPYYLPHSTGTWYHIGQLNASGTKVNWGPSRHLTCCFAMYPSVAITNEGYVIFSYSTGQSKKNSDLKMMVGTVDVNGGVDQEIQWKTGKTGNLPFDSGYHNTLAVNASGVIAEAHESGSGGKGIYYRLGHLKDPANGDFNVVWDTGDYGKNYGNGINPHISIDDNGEVVEVHQAAANDYKLHYIRGKLNANSIKFNNSQPQYNSNGQRPAVALQNDGYLVEVHDNGDSVFYRTGQLDSKDASKINWSETQPIPKGKSLESNSVSSNGYFAVATAFDDDYDTLRYSVAVAP
jgi:hypothetical protein